MARLDLLYFFICMMWITVLNATTSSSMEKGDFSCYDSEGETFEHSLICLPNDGKVSRIIIDGVLGDNVGSDDVSRRCNGKTTCDVHTVVSANDKHSGRLASVFIIYQCVQASSFHQLNDSSTDMVEGLIEVNSNQTGTWNITTSTKAITLFLVQNQEESFEKLSKTFFWLNSNGDMVPLFNTLSPVGTRYANCTTKQDIDGAMKLEIRDSADSLPQRIGQYFISVKGVNECNDINPQAPLVLKRYLNCTLNSPWTLEQIYRSSTTTINRLNIAPNDTTPNIVNKNTNRGQNDDEADAPNDSTPNVVNKNTNRGQNDDEADAPNNSTPTIVNKKQNRGQNDDEADGDGELEDTKAIIGVVATLAIVLIIICIAVLIAKCVKKRRSRERPLLVSSHKIEPNNPDIPLEQFVAVKGYVNVDGFSLSDYRLSAPSNQGVHNASFTDTIDLDGNAAADSVGPFVTKTNAESLADTGQEPLDGVQLDREISPGPVSYESEFEGSLEQLRHEMTMETSDGGSSEELSQGRLPDALDASSSCSKVSSDSNQGQEIINTDKETGNKESVTPTLEDVVLEIPERDAETDEDTDRKSSHLDSALYERPEQVIEASEVEVNNNPDQSEAHNISNEHNESDGSDSPASDVVDLTADFSEC